MGGVISVILIIEVYPDDQDGHAAVGGDLHAHKIIASNITTTTRIWATPLTSANVLNKLVLWVIRLLAII